MARLTVLEGPNPGAVYEVQSACVLGRALDCQVHIQDLTVSRRHARISRVEGGFIAEDLGSGNGTFVNGNAISRAFLRSGDIVRVSGLQLQFDDDDSTPWHAPSESVTMVATLHDMPHIVEAVDAESSILDLALGATDLNALQKMAQRLGTIYAVSEAIGSLLDLSQLLPEILNRLFGIFPDISRAFIMLREHPEAELVPMAVKRRQGDDGGEIKISSTILNQVLSNKQAVLSRDAMTDARFVQGLSVANLGVRSMMCAPLIFRDDPVGIIYLDTEALASFAQADLELLNGIAGQASVAIGNAQLHKQLLKRQQLEQDLRLAERIQQSFLPRKIPERPGWSFVARYDPAYEVGGDFYDFVELPDDRVAVIVGDVSGKGVSAALYMARLTRDIRYFALSDPDPAQVLVRMNQAVLESGHDDIFVTMTYVVVDSRTCELVIGNAAHMPPAIRSAGPGSVKLLDEVSGLPLGVLEDAEYESQHVSMRPGDTLMLYTDGLVEAMNPAQEMFGLDRLTDTLKEGRSEAQALFTRTLEAVQNHVGDAPQFDDTTIVCVGVRAPRGHSGRRPTRRKTTQ